MICKWTDIKKGPLPRHRQRCWISTHGLCYCAIFNKGKGDEDDFFTGELCELWEVVKEHFNCGGKMPEVNPHIFELRDVQFFIILPEAPKK